MNKYCRICWNTKNWRQPSGEARARETGTSFVADHGYGHEEWLFNFSWLLRGYDKGDPVSYRYGFLQPMGKLRARYQGEVLSVLLYTIAPDGTRLIVARIDNLYIPSDEELKWALKGMIKNGWLKAMRDDLEALKASGIDVDDSPLIDPRPESIANVRFQHKSVSFYDPWVTIEGNHKINKVNRYQPLKWDGGLPSVSTQRRSKGLPKAESADDDPMRREGERTRAAVAATTYDPRHIQLQNRLYHALCTAYGKTVVEYERDAVDLTVQANGGVTYIEIKMELTVKRCIRHAIGQLLEYVHYPYAAKATKLLVVGDAFPQEDDIAYLRYIRATYRVPLYYARWNGDAETLEEEV